MRVISKFVKSKGFRVLPCVSIIICFVHVLECVSIVLKKTVKEDAIGESLLTFFCLIIICLSLSDEANKITSLNIERT